MRLFIVCSLRSKGIASGKRFLEQMPVDSYIQQIWYGQRRFASLLLLPLSWVFGTVVTLRRVCFRLGICKSFRVARPVIVVGNITVGGTGKTPLVVWLAQALRKSGQTPGVIARGYRGRAEHWPLVVSADTDPGLGGDEAVLLARLTHGIVVAGPDRVAAARKCVELGATVVISDDGLQHYRLRRDFEIAVVDGGRGVGNARMLPAGPLREPSRRLRAVDAVLVNEKPARTRRISRLNQKIAAGEIGRWTAKFRLVAAAAHNLVSGESRPLTAFANRRVHAVAGIGNPWSFFDDLRTQGLLVDARPLRDHADLTAADFRFGDADPVLMTEKDAVKCQEFAADHWWAVIGELAISDVAAARLLADIDSLCKPNTAPG
jgi:tetraacyldisaccharide 4'-kinase